MALPGPAALLLAFDIAPDAIAEHDDWHTHEHLPERLAIPGFLRGTRWVALHEGAPRYVVLYEVQALGTLVSDAYLQRLNQPTAWTAKMMPHYRGMARGLCAVVARCGVGLGHFGLVLRFEPTADAKAALLGWLVDEVLPTLPMRPGLASAQVLEAAAPPPMTNEQRIRGGDAGLHLALLVTGYSEQALADLSAGALSPAALQAHGAAGIVGGLYRTHCTLSAQDLGR
jgi:hypothetical protein